MDVVDACAGRTNPAIMSPVAASSARNLVFMFSLIVVAGIRGVRRFLVPGARCHVFPDR